MPNNIPDDYEDALTRLLKPKEERTYNEIADFVYGLDDISIRLELAKVIEAGVNAAAVTYFLNYLNRNVSSDKFTMLTCTLMLSESSVFKKNLECYFNIPEQDINNPPLIRLFYTL